MWMRKSAVRLTGLLAMLTLSLSACQESGASTDVRQPKLPVSSPSYRGPVIQTDSLTTRFLVQLPSPAATLSGRMWFGVKASTVILSAAGSRLTANQIRPGDVLSAWVSDPIVPTDPGQATADTLMASTP